MRLSRSGGSWYAALALALSLALPAAARAAQKTDVVLLKNGDRVTCEIQSLSNGLLTVDTDDMGTIKIEWDKVRTVTSSRLFELETTSGARWYGSLAAAGPGQVAIVGATTTAFDQMLVYRVTPIESGFWHRLDGSVSMGGSYTKSSGVGQVYGSFELRARRPAYEWAISYDSTTTFQEGEPDSGRYTGRVGYTRLLQDRWLLIGYSQLDSNPDLGFNLRTAVGGVVGRNLIQRNRTVFQVGGGMTFNVEQPVDGDHRTNAEALAIARYSIVTYDYPKSEAIIGLSVLPSTSDPGRVRVGTNAKLSRAIFTNDFVFAITAFDDYDSRPPAGAVDKNDVGLSFSLGWKF